MGASGNNVANNQTGLTDEQYWRFMKENSDYTKALKDFKNKLHLEAKASSAQHSSLAASSQPELNETISSSRGQGSFLSNFSNPFASFGSSFSSSSISSLSAVPQLKFTLSSNSSAEPQSTPVPIQILVWGDNQVGKSSLLKAASDNTVCREREVKGQKVSLYFLERKNDRFEKKNMTIQWMNYPHVIILCYDVSNRESFENIKRYQQEIERYTPKKKVKAKIILVANKIDLGARAVSREEGENLASQLKFGRYLEISAKTSQQVKVVALAAAELGLEVMAELANSVVSSSHPSSFSRLTFGNK